MPEYLYEVLYDKIRNKYELVFHLDNEEQVEWILNLVKLEAEKLFKRGYV